MGWDWLIPAFGTQTRVPVGTLTCSSTLRVVCQTPNEIPVTLISFVTLLRSMESVTLVLGLVPDDGSFPPPQTHQICLLTLRVGSAVWVVCLSGLVLRETDKLQATPSLRHVQKMLDQEDGMFLYRLTACQV